jgi:hypothetical protein
MEGATERPHIEFSVGGETRGIEYAVKVREQQGNPPRLDERAASRNESEDV